MKFVEMFQLPPKMFKLNFVQDEALKSIVKEYDNESYHSDSYWGNHIADCY